LLKAKAKAKDLAFKAKAKAKDSKFVLEYISRPRTKAKDNNTVTYLEGFSKSADPLCHWYCVYSTTTAMCACGETGLCDCGETGLCGHGHTGLCSH